MSTVPEENISFESMPDFGSFLKPSPKSGIEDKFYKSLYEELAEKCNPREFVKDEKIDKTLFDKANEIYSDLITRPSRNDADLIDLREKAEHELGIHFSTKRLFDFLKGYFDPNIYIAIKPYNAERVAKAVFYYDGYMVYKPFHLEENEETVLAIARKRAENIDVCRQVNPQTDYHLFYYDQLLQNKNDIHALEKLEIEAQEFISQRNEETKREVIERYINGSGEGDSYGVIIVIVCVFFIILGLIAILALNS